MSVSSGRLPVLRFNMRRGGLVIQFRLMYRLADRFRSRGFSLAAASSFKKGRIDAGL
ncbi:hypothetical protein [Mesorhizobium sp. GbtcB19]|uniref:hypothetical protein n=1 Tax=Mesorhizobium sp. GbtcB19 TaxID=2824764 RepID=UPI001C2FC7C9|nr:hypothetical protein [Mesorhizobium sp. GbtcB19]